MNVNPGVYGPQFVTWWRGMQPTWRLLPGEGFSKETSTNLESWALINKGGSAGLYIVVMALSWWVLRLRDAGTADTDAQAVWGTVDDVAWVLKQLLSLHAASKRSLPSISDAKVFKRRCVVLFFYHE